VRGLNFAGLGDVQLHHRVDAVPQVARLYHEQHQQPYSSVTLPTFTIFSLNQSVLGANDRSRPLFFDFV